MCGCYSSWLSDEMHPTIDTITKRIAAITHLDMETVEDLQVVNYGIGGQYEPHYDHSRVGTRCARRACTQGHLRAC